MTTMSTSPICSTAADMKTVKVGRGDTLAGIITKVGVEPIRGQGHRRGNAPVFPAQNLKPGQEVRFNLDPGAGRHRRDGAGPRQRVSARATSMLGSVTRNHRGDFVVTEQKGAVTAEAHRSNSSAPRSITSFYHAALSQHIPAETILKLLRVHSYDVDFKQKVKPGDSFDVFFDVPDHGLRPRRDGRAALHLDDRRRPDPELLSLPHPGRPRRLL